MVLGIFCFNDSAAQQSIQVGAEQISEYLPLLKNKKVGLVVNHTSNIGKTHLVDFLLTKKIKITYIFAPEHGFRGEASAGDHINNSVDKKTGIAIASLYGKNKKPTAAQLKNIDVLIFDIQDVGVRFYTYISTLNYVMQACAENKKPLIVLDRPNPNGHYVAGPVLDTAYKSFVGVNPIPVVYGMTMAELAQMNNGENWLGKNLKCKLKVIKCKNYTHNSRYELPIKPSPNLPNFTSIALYPSLCLLEPTQVSVGRGTDMQFQVLGGPDTQLGKFTFTPEDKPGAMNPVNEGKLCYGEDFRNVDAHNHRFTIKYLYDFYNNFKNKNEFFTSKSFCEKLIGNSWVIDDISKNIPLETIEAKWEKDLQKFLIKRKKYLIYE